MALAGFLIFRGIGVWRLTIYDSGKSGVRKMGLLETGLSLHRRLQFLYSILPCRLTRGMFCLFSVRYYYFIRKPIGEDYVLYVVSSVKW